MYRLILVDSAGDTFSKMLPALQEDKRVLLCQADSGIAAFDALSRGAWDLALPDEQLTDMTGLEFARRLVARYPLVNCALVSSMADTEFHEATEGLGIIAKLPPDPDQDHAGELLQKLESILRLQGGPPVTLS